MNKEEIVCIEWEDASFISGYYDPDKPENFHAVPTKTVGFLVIKGRRAVVVSQDRFYFEDGSIDSDRHLSIIPRKMIKSIKVMRQQATENAKARR